MCAPSLVFVNKCMDSWALHIIIIVLTYNFLKPWPYFVAVYFQPLPYGIPYILTVPYQVVGLLTLNYVNHAHQVE